MTSNSRSMWRLPMTTKLAAFFLLTFLYSVITSMFLLLTLGRS